MPNRLTRRHFVGSALAASAASPQTRVRSLVIDCHVHAGAAHRLTDPWHTIANPEAILRRMDAAGIDQSVVFPIHNETYERANREIASIVQRFPGRFIGFAKHDPETEKGRIRELLLSEFNELGLRGLKLHGHPGPEILDVVGELRIPILYHPRRVAQIDEVARRYPMIDILIAHLGSDLSVNWKEHEAAIDLAVGRPNVFLDTGATVITRYIEQAVEQAGAEKVIFGSDEPEVDCRLEIFKIRVLDLPPEQERLILGGNMQRLLAKSSEAAA
jgi:predicted TIM-barrel fold metal-dependent hydrolase